MQNVSSGQILPFNDTKSIVNTPSTENDRITFFNCSNYCSTVIIAVSALIAAFAVFYSQQFNYLQLMKYSENDKLALLNATFYKGEQSRRTPVKVRQDFISVYQKTFTNLKSCKSSSLLSVFFGESGIGKTTILKESLRISSPFPYVLIDLESVSDWKDIGILLGVTNENEDATQHFIFSKLSAYFESVSDRNVCPIIILDSANRNIEITKSFISLWRRRKGEGKQFGLLLVSSDGKFKEIPDAGGRMAIQELEVTSLFVKKYIRTEFGITDTKVLDTILDVAGPKMVFLEIVGDYILDGNFDIEGFVGEIDNRLNFQFNKLESQIIENIFKIVRLLSENQSSAQAEMGKLPTREKKSVLKSNFIKQDPIDKQVTFQNKAVERFLRKKLFPRQN